MAEKDTKAMYNMMTGNMCTISQLKPRTVVIGTQVRQKAIVACTVCELSKGQSKTESLVTLPL